MSKACGAFSTCARSVWSAEISPGVMRVGAVALGKFVQSAPARAQAVSAAPLAKFADARLELRALEFSRNAAAPGEPVARGGMVPLHVHGPHAWFGEQALLGGQASQVDYVCMTQVELIGMRQSCLENALREEPEFRRFMLQLLARRVELQTEFQLLLRLGGMPLRVVMGLAQFAVNQPQSFSAQIKPHPEDTVDISLSQDQIAAVCGVSRTLFSECLQKLARGGWVKLRYGGMSLQSAAAWRFYARQWQQRQKSVSRQSMNELLDELSQASIAALSPVTLQ